MRLSTAWRNETDFSFKIRQREFDYGCRPTAYDAYRTTSKDGWKLKERKFI